MRIYIPVSAYDLREREISARRVHGVLPAARQLFDAAYGESLDQESYEWLATLYAADDSICHIASAMAHMRAGLSVCSEGGARAEGAGVLAQPHEAEGCLAAGLYRRLVAVGEVPDEWVKAECAHVEAPPTACTLVCAVPWEKIESIYVDEPGSEELVRRASEGDTQALEASGDIELLWYGVTERDILSSELLAS